MKSKQKPLAQRRKELDEKMAEYEYKLSSLEADFEEKNYHLHRKIREREVDLDDREIRLNDREHSLNAFERRLDVRSAAFEQAQTDLDSKIAWIRQRTLTHAISKLSDLLISESRVAIREPEQFSDFDRHPSAQ